MTFTLTCMAGELARILSLASNVSGHTKQVPILKACRIAVTKGMANVSATDTDHGMRASIAAEGKGEVYVEIALMLQKATALRATEPVTMAADKDGKFITMSQGKTRWRVPVLLGDGFPIAMTEPLGGEHVTIPRRKLFGAIAAVLPNVEGMGDGVMGMGVYLDASDGFHAVAASRRALYVRKMDCDPIGQSIILPTGSANAMMAMFRDVDDVAVTVTPESMTIDGGDVMYRTKLIEGAYPDWRKVAAHQTKAMNGNASISRQAAIDAINRASAIAIDGTKGASPGVRVTFADGEFQARASNRNGEEGFDACPADGDNGTTALATAKIVDALSGMSGDELALRYSTEEDGPVHISAGDDDWRILMNMLAVK